MFLVALAHTVKGETRWVAPRKGPSLSQVIRKPTKRTKARTIRAQGGGNNPRDQRCFRSVELKNGSTYKLTVADMLKLQGFKSEVWFPKNMSEGQKQKLIGNAVPPLVSAVVFNAVKHALMA